MVGCPQCGTSIQQTWDWCEACGFDPEGLKPAGWRPSVAAHDRPATAPRQATPPPNWGAPPPGAQAQSHTSGGGQHGGFAPPPFAPAPGYPGMYGPPPKQSNAGATVLKIFGGIAVVFVLLIVVCIAAVTMLGKNASSKFSRIDMAIDNPPTAFQTSTIAPPANWQTWKSPKGSFAIDFPTAPTDKVHAPQVNVIYEHDVSSLARTGGFFVVYGELDVPIAAINTTEVDGRVIETMRATAGRATGRVATATVAPPSQFLNKPATRFTITMPGGNMTGIMIHDGARYFVVYESIDAGLASEFDRFLASFLLL